VLRFAVGLDDTIAVSHSVPCVRCRYAVSMDFAVRLLTAQGRRTEETDFPVVKVSLIRTVQDYHPTRLNGSDGWIGSYTKGVRANQHT
jgi:hypothetical protein